MRMFVQRQWLAGGCALILAVLAFVPGAFFTRGTFGDDSSSRTIGAPDRPFVSYLKEVRPILAQHCFQCHGPDEAARKGKLRFDLKDHAFAERDGKHVIAPGDLAGSLVWQRIASDDDDDRMPPKGKAEPLTE